MPSGALLFAIVNTWGSFADFKIAFEASSNNVFGSGYTWLCVNSES